MTIRIDPALPKVKLGGINKGCVMHLPLDQQSYNPATKRFSDATPFCNHGISANAANFVADRMGQANRAMSFNGTSDYINCGSGGSLDITDKATISLWAKWSNTQNGILALKYAGGGTPGFYIQLTTSGSNYISAIFYTASGDSWAKVPIDYSDDEWHHIVYVWDGTSQVYVDNVAVGSAGYSLTGSIANAENLYIGGGEGVNFFIGSIADVRIYNIATSAKVRTALFEQYRPKFLI